MYDNESYLQMLTPQDFIDAMHLYQNPEKYTVLCSSVAKPLNIFRSFCAVCYRL